MCLVITCQLQQMARLEQDDSMMLQRAEEQPVVTPVTVSYTMSACQMTDVLWKCSNRGCLCLHVCVFQGIEGNQQFLSALPQPGKCLHALQGPVHCVYQIYDWGLGLYITQASSSYPTLGSYIHSLCVGVQGCARPCLFGYTCRWFTHGAEALRLLWPPQWL